MSDKDFKKGSIYPSMTNFELIRFIGTLPIDS